MSKAQEARRLRVLFLCTQNSARSQMAEALLQTKHDPRLLAASAGTHPAGRVHPLAVEVLAEHGIDWSAARPKAIEAVAQEPWDFVITVCDKAQEACPTFPGRPVTAHWGVPDPAAVVGDDARRRRAFHAAAQVLGHRIDLMLALPFEQLEALALEQRLRAIGREGASFFEPAPGGPA
jgi:arsenate reductase